MHNHIVTDASRALERLLQIRAEERDQEEAKDEARKNPPFIQLAEKKIPDLRKHLKENPVAIDIFLFLAQHMGRDNIVICPIAVLMEETSKSRSTVSRSIKYLRENGLLCIVKFGSSYGYALDGTYVWKTFNHPGRYAVFEKAKALASKAENQVVTKKLASIFKNQSASSEIESEEESSARKQEEEGHHPEQTG